MDNAGSDESAQESAFGSTSRHRVSRFETFKETVSDKLRSAAEAIGEKADSTNEENRLTYYGRQASAWLNQFADYVENMDLKQLNRDIRNRVRRTPGRCLLIAGAAGLIIGVLFRRR